MNEILRPLFNAILEGDQYAASTHVQAGIEAGIDPAEILNQIMVAAMPSMKNVIDANTEAGLRQHVKIMVGGAPIPEAFAKQTDADGYAPDASQAVTNARIFLALSLQVQ